MLELYSIILYSKNSSNRYWMFFHMRRWFSKGCCVVYVDKVMEVVPAQLY